jgi:hypothetical protein
VLVGVPVVVSAVIGAVGLILGVAFFDVGLAVLSSPFLIVAGVVAGPLALITQSLPLMVIVGVGALLGGVAMVADLSYQAGRRNLAAERKAILASVPATSQRGEALEQPLTTLATF